MAQMHRIARIAHDRVVTLIELVEVACDDGEVTPMERRMIAAAAHDAMVTARASYATDALASAIGRATSAKHLVALTRMAQAAVDELPETAA